MKKFTKSDMTFMVAMVFFAIVCFSRFFDEKIKKHIVLFDFMQEYEWAIFFTVLYFIILLLFFVVCISCCKEKYRRDIYYLIFFYATFVFPMFLSSRYFGVTDIYAWMMAWITLMFLIYDKAEWITVILCFLISLISPMSVLTAGCALIVIHGYKFLYLQKKKYLYYLIACTIASVLGVIVAQSLGTFSTDAQSILSLERFIMLLIVLSPYIYIAGDFFFALFKKTKEYKRWGYVLLLVGLLPATITYIVLEDYARVFSHVFSYVILIVLIFVARNDWDVICQLQRTKEFIKRWVPIPILVIAIPFLFMTLWIAGEQHLMKEVFINK